MPARLVPLNLTTTIAPVIPLQRPVILIGRHPECDARIDAPQISRRHCCVALASNQVIIRDLGSRNGLRVNGRIIEETALKLGDEVAIGQFLYRLENLVSAPTPAPVPASAPLVPPPIATRNDDLDDLIPLEDD